MASVPYSAKDRLQRARNSLFATGFDIDELEPQRREHTHGSFSRPDYYTSPIEFSANGVVISLYGNYLVVDGEKTGFDVFHHSIEDIARQIASLVKNKTAVVRKVSSTVVARYLKTSIGR